MQIEIDQSWRIEYTNKASVVAYSDTKSKTLKISAREKKNLQQLFRLAGRGRLFVFRVFAALIFLLIRDSSDQIEQVVIDEEYPGWEAQIKSYLLRYIRKERPDFPKTSIVFQKIGKKSEAHWAAYRVFKGERKADIEVSAKDVLEVLFGE